jgi:hypothetical protein
MLRSTFLTHVNHNDDTARDAQENNVSMGERRAFTTPANVNDDLRREMDGLTHRTAWPGEDTAYVNGLPLYAPARYFDKAGNVQSARAKPAAKPATTWKGPAPAAGSTGTAGAGGSTETVIVDRWPWWIWPLAAAAAVAVRGQ